MKLSEIIRKEINERIDNSNTTELIYGKVVSINPLSIRIDNRFVIPKDFIVLSPLVKDIALKENDDLTIITFHKRQLYYVIEVNGEIGVGGASSYEEITNKPSLNTLNNEPQEAKQNEIIQNIIKLHKIAKTGSYNDLNDIPDNLIISKDKSVNNIQELTKEEYEELPQEEKNKGTFFITNDNINSNDVSGVNKILDLVYPVGRGFIDFTDTDYTNYLGFKWEKTLVGLTPVGKDPNQIEFDTLGKKGGEKNHKLTIEEMPSHNHKHILWTDTNFVYTYKNGGNKTVLDLAGQGIFWRNDCDFDKTGKIGTDKAGGDIPHNNLQPYEVVNYWKRIE
nr:MAG TPA: baseplate protein [Caudoviricetes sp.]